MKVAFISICSQSYLNQYQILFDSLKLHSPESTQILYHIGTADKSYDQKVDITSWYNSTIYSDPLDKICSLRPRVVLDALSKGFQKVIFLGADVEFFGSPAELIVGLDYHDAIVTPHILEPLPNDGKSPSNSSIAWSGHLNTDVVGYFNCEAIKRFLIWQDETLKTQCIVSGHIFLDQTWFNFIHQFVPNVLILHRDTYNVAYWNFKQRDLKIVNNRWVTKDGSLICYQYSGLVKGQEEQISKHQNREVATGDFLEFLKAYTSKL